MSNAISVAEIRAQERHQRPQILAGGIGFSLLIHLLAAIAFNYLLLPMPAEVVEITMIDASELPPELLPEPSSTVSITAPSKVPSSPSVPSPLPTPPVIKSAIEPITQQSPTSLPKTTTRLSPIKTIKKTIDRSTKKIQLSPRSPLSPTTQVNPSIGQPLINNAMPSVSFRPPSPSITHTQPVTPSVLQKPGKISEQTNTKKQSNSSNLPFTAPIPRPLPQISSSPTSIDRLDQQDDLDVLTTATPNNSPPLQPQPVRPPSSTNSAIAQPSIANNSSLPPSSNLQSGSRRPFGQAQNTEDIISSKNHQGSPPASQTPGKGISGSNSIAGGGGRGTGRSANNVHNGKVVSNNHSSASASITLRCAPAANCKPPYPEAAQGATGVTVLEILLADDGAVSSALISKSSGNNLFDRAAVEATPTMRFVLPPGRQRKFRVAIKFIPEAG